MAYQSIEPDDRLESGTDGLEFKSFLGDAASGQDDAPHPTSGGSARGYYGEQRPSASSGFWTIEYYQKYFDVDTKTVLTRCYTTLLPRSSTYLSAHLTPSVDLYGPFWTLTTLIFSLFVFSSLASSISSYLSDVPVTYDFQLLSIAVTLVYTYGIVVPILLWLMLRYLGVSEWSPVEGIAVFGYGQFVWIPVSLLCVIPVPIVRWVLVLLGSTISGAYLVANIYPVLSSAEQKATRLIVVILVFMHAALAFTFKILFFSYYVVQAIGGKDPLGGEGPITSSVTTNSSTALM